MAAENSKIAELVAQMPEVDNPGQPSKFTGPAPAEAEKIFSEILASGRDSIRQLLTLIRDPSDPDFDTYKAGYLLHGLALHAGRPGHEAQRRLLADTISEQLNSSQPSLAVKVALIRELQVVGGKEVIDTLGKQLFHAGLCESAAQALLAIRDGASAPLRQALPKVEGTSRVTILQALGVLRDRESIAALTQSLADKDQDIRIAAAWGLANIGEASAEDAVMKLASGAEGWERIQTTKACLLLAEKLQAAGKITEAHRIYTHLRDQRKGPAERHVREAAERALQIHGAKSL